MPSIITPPDSAPRNDAHASTPRVLPLVPLDGRTLAHATRARSSDEHRRRVVTGADHAARCRAFLDRLEAMSRAEWLAVGARTRTADDGSEAALDAVIARRGLAVTGWLVCDTVQTLAWLASCAHDAPGGRRYPVPPTRAERATLAAACRAAELAARAYLAGPWLDGATYRALLGPFAPPVVDAR